MPTREEQRAERRWLIMEKAAELFAKRGYAETKIGDIAKAADMSVGLMFHYFESKEQLYEELIKMGAEFTKSPLELNFTDPINYFELILAGLFRYAKEQPFVLYMFILMAQTRRSDAVPAHIREIAMSIDQTDQSAEIIEAGQQYGYFRAGDPKALSWAFWCSVQGVMEQLAVFPDTPAPDPAWLLDIIRGERNDKNREPD